VARHGAMTFRMARQPLSALQNSTAVGKLVVDPLRRQWTSTIDDLPADDLSPA